MAKLKAPFLSLGASGQLGKAVVAFPWKGIDALREYVIPTNPKSAKQQTQRGYLSGAVALIHTCQKLAANPLDADDCTAYALLGSIHPTPRTWFNEACKINVDSKVAGKDYGVCCNGTITEVEDELDIELWTSYTANPTAGDFWYGVSKTALLNKEAATVLANKMSATIAGLVSGTKYYIQFRPTAPAGAVGVNSGIYTGIPL